MGLIKKIFGDKSGGRDTGTPASQFLDSESDAADQQESKNTARREAVQTVLRDTMRRHGIPSDWMECRILSVPGRSAIPGMHVLLVVRQGHDRLLTYVPAFQASYLMGIEKFDSKPAEWLLSLSWQFEGLSGMAQMPDPAAWTKAGAAAVAAAAVPASVNLLDQDDELEEDLKALYAIRDAAMSQEPRRPPPGHNDFEHTQPSD